MSRSHREYDQLPPDDNTEYDQLPSDDKTEYDQLPPDGKADDELISDMKNQTPHELSYKVKLVKTLSMLLIYLTLGLWMGVISPSIIDLTEHFNCNYEQLSDALMTRAIGILGGSFVGAIVSDWYRPNADFYLCIAPIIGGIAYIVFPLLSHLWIAGVLMAINGVVHGSLNVVCSSICLAMWGEKAATPILTLHMAFTIGSTIGPAMSEPFVTYQNGTQNKTVGPQNTQLIFQHGAETSSVLYFPGIKDILSSSNGSSHNATTSQFEIPYYISGGLGVFTGVIFGIFFLLGLKYSPRVKSSSQNTHQSKLRRMLPDVYNHGNACFITYVLLSLFGLYVSNVLRANSLNLFLYTIAVKSTLNMVTSEATILATVYNAMSAVGRLVIAILARCVRTDILLFAQIFLALGIQILMVFYALEKPLYMWVLACGMGLAVGPTYPTIMAWVDFYIEVSGFVVAVIDIGIGIGAFLSTWLAGHLFQHYGSEWLMYLTAIGGGCLCLLFVPLYVTARVHGMRKRVKRTSYENDDDPLIN